MPTSTNQLRQRVELVLATYLRLKVGQDSFLYASANSPTADGKPDDVAYHKANKAIYQDESDATILLEAAIVSCPDAEVKVPDIGLHEASLHLMAMVSADSPNAQAKAESITGELDLFLFDPYITEGNPYVTAVTAMNALNLGLYIYQIDKLNEAGQVVGRHWINSLIYAVNCQVMDLR